MPTLQEIEKGPDLKKMQDDLRGGEQPNHEFGLSEHVNLTRSSTAGYTPPVQETPTPDSAYWREIKVEFVGGMFPKDVARRLEVTDVIDADEEPFFVVSTNVADTVGVVPIPSGNVKEVKPKHKMPYTDNGDILVAEYQRLDDEQDHKVIVKASAWDGSTNVGQKLLDAFASDLGGYVAAGIALVPGPHNTLNAVWDTIKDAFAGLKTPDQVGDNLDVLNERDHPWPNAIGAKKWVGLKWTAFQEDDSDLWYLTLWRITLDMGPRWKPTKPAGPQAPKRG